MGHPRFRAVRDSVGARHPRDFAGRVGDLVHHLAAAVVGVDSTAGDPYEVLNVNERVMQNVLKVAASGTTPGGVQLDVGGLRPSEARAEDDDRAWPHEDRPLVQFRRLVVGEHSASRTTSLASAATITRLLPTCTGPRLDKIGRRPHHHDLHGPLLRD